MFGMGNIHDIFNLESKILDLFKEAKGPLDAHGMGASCGVRPYQLFNNYKV
jgi:hypothetical protein